MSIVKRYTCLATLISLGLAGASAQADVINGYAINPRVFNDNPGSTLTFTPPAIPFNPATFSINDVYSGAFAGANQRFLAVPTRLIRPPPDIAGPGSHPGDFNFFRRYSEGRQPIHLVKALEKTNGFW